MMTTLTTTLGLLPMALGFGQGSEVRAPMAITVIGGLLVSTLLTLFVIPVVYSILDRKQWAQVAESAPTIQGAGT
jgi:HAE1 family hydrophobic/amphiphilic exporter-1